MYFLYMKIPRWGNVYSLFYLKIGVENTLHIFQIKVYSVSFSQGVSKSVNTMTVLAKQVGIEIR